MLKSKLVSIVRNVSNIILEVGLSEDIESATEHINVMESQPSFLYSKESLDELKKIFPIKQWEEGMSIEELAHSKGQQDIINFIERRLGKERLKVLG